MPYDRANSGLDSWRDWAYHLFHGVWHLVRVEWLHDQAVKQTELLTKMLEEK